MSISSKQRAFLRKKAHHLKPLLQVGSGGISSAFITSLEEAFGTRELLKVKILDGAPVGAKEAAGEIVAKIEGAEVAQKIGRTLVIYREHPENPEIVLP